MATLDKPTPVADDGFGDSVAVSGSTVVVGAPSHDTATTHAGAAYVFDLDNPEADPVPLAIEAADEFAVMLAE